MRVLKILLRVTRIGIGALLILISLLTGITSLSKKASPELPTLIGEWSVYVVLFVIGLVLVRIKSKDEKKAKPEHAHVPEARPKADNQPRNG